MKRRVLIKRILIYFVLVLTAFVLQTSVFGFFSFLSVTPNLVLIVVFSYGFIYGSTTGMVCGIWAGLLMDLFYSQLMGLYILIFTYIGFFSGMFRGELRSDSLVMPAVLSVLAELFYSVAGLLITFFSLGHVDIAASLTRFILPETFFTLLVTIFAYKVFLLTMRRLDEKDDIRGKLVA